MKVRLLPSAGSGDPRHQFLISTLIDDQIAIDAGSLGLLPLREQRAVKHVFLTHSHCDHIATLPMFLENAHDPGADCVKIYGHPATLDSLQRNVFNDELWPDFVELIHRDTRFCELIEVTPQVPIQVGQLAITAIPLDHVVPNLGYLIDDGRSAIALVSDTGPTEAIWQAAKQLERLQAVLIEASFPNDQLALATVSQHLTPELLAVEYQKLDRPVPFMAMHIKPAFYDTIVQELHALHLPGLIVGIPGLTYRF